MSFINRLSRLNQLLAAKRALAIRSQSVSSNHNEFSGTREVVGFGFNGSCFYYDAPEMPYPAIRFREETDEIKKIREKEKNDWKQLTLEEKKKLYRHNFCLTLSEVEAPTGEWKIQLSIVLFTIAFALFYIGFAKKNFYGPLPETMTPEGKQRTRDLEILYKTNPIFGLASKFDYEKGDWK